MVAYLKEMCILLRIHGMLKACFEPKQKPMLDLTNKKNQNTDSAFLGIGFGSELGFDQSLNVVRNINKKKKKKKRVPCIKTPSGLNSKKLDFIFGLGVLLPGKILKIITGPTQNRSASYGRTDIARDNECDGTRGRI